MTFPVSSILDNFNRANQGPPPTGWTTVYNGHKIVSNLLLGNTSSDANVSAWNTTGYGPSIEAYITLTNAGSIPTLYVLDSSLTSGYSVSYDGAVKIYREDTFGSSSTQLGATITQTFSNGDALGIFYNANTDTIYVYRKPLGGAWTELGSRTDSTYTSLSRIALFSWSTATLDDFGGGTVTTGITGNVGLVSETDLAQAVARRKSKVIGQVSETDAAQTVTAAGPITVAMAQASETDAAQAVTRRKSKVIGQVSETDAALGISMQVTGYPLTGILDNFNRADEAPMTGWTDVQGGLAVVSNQCKGVVSGSGVPAANNAIYTAQSYSPDQEAFVTVINKPSNTQEINLHVRIDDIEAPNGYSLIYYRTSDGQDKHYIVRYVDGVWSIITDEYYVTINNGDSLGIRVAGDVITGYHKPVGGSWVVLVPSYNDSANHATHYHGGYVGLNHNSNTIITDDFGGGGIVITADVNQVSETDEAFQVSRVKYHVVGQASETDSAQGIVGRKQKVVGQNAETDAALSITVRKARALGIAAETDIAQALGTQIIGAVNQVSETDATFAVSRRKTKLTGQASETDAAQAVSRRKSKVTGQASEADSLFALTGRKVVVIGQANEADAALSLGTVIIQQMGQAVETDEATSIEARKVFVVLPVAETDLAQALFPQKRVSIAQAVEVDSAISITQLGTIFVPLEQVTETDGALSILAGPFFGTAILSDSLSDVATMSDRALWVAGLQDTLVDDANLEIKPL